MKKAIFILVLFYSLLMACTSSEDEPINDIHTDNRTDWIVTYKETCYSNPQWINQNNTSAECIKWKQLHQSDLVSHTQSGFLDEEMLVWKVRYSNLTEAEVEKEVLEFVRFTTCIKAQPNNDNKYGSDIFEATLTDSKQARFARYNHKSSLFWFDNSSFRYRIEYHETRTIQDGDWLTEPPMLEDWSRNHELCYQSITANSRSRIWIENADDWNVSDVHTKVDPFIAWSVGDLNAKSYHRLSVRVHDYKDDITIWYSKYCTTN